MKLIGSLTLIWTLCRTAEALSCYDCRNQVCDRPVSQTCPSSEPMCITASIRASGGQLTYQGCASSSVCESTSNKNVSLSLYKEAIIVSALCCNTNDCNVPILPAPAPPMQNSLQCFSCGLTDCGGMVRCSGEESQCFTSTLNMEDYTYPFMGCMTRNLCDADLSPLLQEYNFNISRLSCCGTSLCNHPLIPLISAVPPVKPTQTSGGSGVKLELFQLVLGLLVCALINDKSMQVW